MTCVLPFDPNQYRSILCLNGELPSKEFFNLNLPIIAADGAANHLFARGIIPQIVIGDLDSITVENLAKVKTHFHFDQDFCDFQKSLFYLEKQALLPAIIVGANGGNLDHILNNINIFLTGNNVLYAPPLYGFCMRSGEQKAFNLPINTKISLLGIPSVMLSTTGLQWDLNQAVLSFPGATSCFNRVKNEEVNIVVESGSVLVLVYYHEKQESSIKV